MTITKADYTSQGKFDEAAWAKAAYEANKKAAEAVQIEVAAKMAAKKAAWDEAEKELERLRAWSRSFGPGLNTGINPADMNPERGSAGDPRRPGLIGVNHGFGTVTGGGGATSAGGWYYPAPSITSPGR